MAVQPSITNLRLKCAHIPLINVLLRGVTAVPNSAVEREASGVHPAAGVPSVSGQKSVDLLKDLKTPQETVPQVNNRSQAQDVPGGSPISSELWLFIRRSFSRSV